MTEVTRYTIGVGFTFSQKETRRFDNYLRSVETKLKAFQSRLDKTMSLNLTRFDVDQRRLNMSLGRALDAATASTAFEINNFVVDQGNLNRAMTAAMQRAALVASRNTNLRPNVEARGTGPGDVIRGRHAIAAGGIGGLAARAYTPVLALAAGGYGLGALNRRNQEVVSAQLQTQAVVQQAGGTQAQGMQSFDYLRQQADRIGFNYLEAAPDFNKLISGLTGAGVGLQESQGVFTGFAELARTNKLDKVAQNRLFRALSQVAGKGKLQSEELVGQIAESLPGGTALFAEAYQRQIGGNLTGKEAISELMAQMKKGNVKSDILTFAAQIASQRAQPTLGSAARASQAEQARFQNQISDAAVRASGAGVESGFSRLFRSLSTALKEAQPLVDSMARGFDNASKSVSSVLLSVQSITRFFQGRDSLIGDKLFPDEESQQKAFLFLENMKTVTGEIGTLTDNIYNGWAKLLNLLDSSPILDKLNTSLSVIANSASVLNNIAGGNYSGAADAAVSVGKNYANTITAPGRAGANAILSNFTDLRIPAPFDKGQSQVDWATQYKAEQAKMAAESRNQYPLPGITQPLAQGQRAIDLKIDMSVDIKAANPEDFNQQFQDRFTSVIQETLLQYSQKE